MELKEFVEAQVGKTIRTVEHGDHEGYEKIKFGFTDGTNLVLVAVGPFGDPGGMMLGEDRQ